MAAAAAYSFLVQLEIVGVRAAREWEARGAGQGEAQEPLQPRARLLSCVLREVERARGSGGDYFAASFGSRQRRV